MFKYASYRNDDVSICPYCGNSYQVEAEDYDDEEQEIICEECDKKYWLCQEFTVAHHTKPDCELNGAAHIYQPIENNGTVEFCKICGQYRPAK